MSIEFRPCPTRAGKRLRVVARAGMALLFLAWGGGGPNLMAEVVDQVAAVVNDEIITISDIRWLIQYKRIPIPDEGDQRQELYLTTLQQIVEQKLIAAEATQTPGIHVSEEEVVARVEAYRRQFESERDFLDNLSAMEMTLDDLMELVRRQLAVLKFVKLRFEPFIIVLPDEIEDYYKQELVPELEKNQQTAPPMSVVEEQIREVLTVEKTNREVDNWVGNAKRKANVAILLGQGKNQLPNIPGAFADQIRLAPVPPRRPPPERPPSREFKP